MKNLLLLIVTWLAILPLRAGNIVFADDDVKALCVANWDSDSDGELSEEEAAAVTSLGTVFQGKKTIKTFDELAYFTGLTTIGERAFFQSGIERVTFPPSVSAIGEYAFSESNIGPEMVIPGHVKSLEAYSFNNCLNLNRVVLEEGVESIGYETFNGPLTYMSLPATIAKITAMAVNPYVNAYPGSGMFFPKGDLTVQVYTETPAAINYYAFYYLFAEGHLIVPYGCADIYKAEPAWSHFGEYIEIGDVNCDGRTDIADVAALIAHVTGNTPERFEEHAADINGDGRIDGEDVSQLCQYLLGS